MKCEAKWLALERKGRKDEEERESEGEGNLGAIPREGEGRRRKPGRSRRTPLFSKTRTVEQPGSFDKIVIIIYHPINVRESGHNLSKRRFLDCFCGQALPLDTMEQS